MINSQNNLNDKIKSSAKNDRYNFINFSKEQFYLPTENNILYPNQRRITSTSYRKNKLNTEQPGFPNVYTSGCPHNTANLYLNKKNFSFKKKANNKGNNYFDKEKLYQNMVKLQISLNNINMKYHKQKMENDKQAKEIERQNKFLNSINSQNMRNWDLLESNIFNKNENNLNNESNEELNLDNNKPNKDNLMKNLMKENEGLVDLDFVLLDDKRYNLKLLNNNGKNLSENSLRKLYGELYQECKYREKLLIKMEKDKEKYTRENGILKVANETLISNLKLHMKKLEQENTQKDIKISELKKNLKCSRYTELLKENEILNDEMEKLKNKIKNALILINEYKKQEEEIKKLYEVIKKKDFKIKALELELTTLANNSDETTKKLQSEINTKDKLLKKQERDMKKTAFENYTKKQGLNYPDTYSTSDENNNKNKKKDLDTKNIYKKYPELYLIFIEMKHKDINSSKNFSNDVLKKIKDTASLEEAKIKYISLVMEYLHINDNDENSKQIIINLANKEFINHRSIYEIKKKQLNIFDSLFNQKFGNKTQDEIKNYIDKNSLEELIKRTFTETDKNKLGYISFDEIKNVINETNLNDYNDEIMLITKSEIFNRFDYYNFLVLFNNENNKDSENKTQEEKTEINNDNNNINNEKDSKEKENNNNNENNLDNKENVTNENKENKVESNDKNEGSKENTSENKEKKENENDNSEHHDENKESVMKKEDSQVNNDKKDEKSQNNELEKKLKSIVHKIKKEGGTPVNYFSQIKEKRNINGNEYEVINLMKMKEFLTTKNIELNEDEINGLKKEYGFNLDNEENKDNAEYINNENFVQKLLNIIQNDSDNDDDFMENIQKYDFAEE